MGRTKGSKNKVKEVVIKEAEECIEEAKTIIAEIANPKRSIEGWVNIYKMEEERCTNFFTGSDLFKTKEEAQRIAQKGCIGQHYIFMEYK